MYMFSPVSMNDIGVHLITLLWREYQLVTTIGDTTRTFLVGVKHVELNLLQVILNSINKKKHGFFFGKSLWNINFIRTIRGN